MGGIPIDYRQLDFVDEIRRLTSVGVDVVFDGIGGPHMWRSRSSLRAGGRVVVYGLTSSLNEGRLSGPRTRLNWMARYAAYVAGSWVLPGRKRVIPNSIQWMKRLRPAFFRQDLTVLFDLLRQNRIKPLVAHRFPLVEATRAHELLGSEGVTGKVVLVCGDSAHAAGSAV
jgi:NADPH2:quinone reductase